MLGVSFLIIKLENTSKRQLSNDPQLPVSPRDLLLVLCSCLNVHLKLLSVENCVELIPVLTALESFVVMFSIDSFQSFSWAVLETRQMQVPIQYLHKHLDKQAGHREVLFFSAKSSPK